MMLHPDQLGLNIPTRWPRPVRLSSSRVVSEGLVRPAILSPRIAERFGELTGVAPDRYRLATRCHAYDPRPTDEIVVQDDVRRLPLMVRRDGEVLVCFDILATQAFEFQDSRRPVYTYVPGFHIQRVPETLRRPVSNLVEAFRSRGSADVADGYRTLPLTDFEFVMLLLHTVAADGLDVPPRPIQWPSGKRAAFVSLHDVDTTRLLRQRDRSPLYRLEQKHGIKSTWFVPSTLLNREPRAADFLLESGNEVGWHGHKHDHRDHVGRFADIAVDALRSSWLNRQTDYPTGMRAPRLLKSHHLFAGLERSCQGLQYDTSFCHGILPYPLWVNGHRSRILEIPTTVPTDIRLYNELAGAARRDRGQLMVKAQVARTERLIDVGGLISIVTHPEKSLSERPEFLDVYDRYLSTVKDRKDIWFTTAGELCKYWNSHQHAAVGDVAQSSRLGERTHDSFEVSRSRESA